MGTLLRLTIASAAVSVLLWLSVVNNVLLGTVWLKGPATIGSTISSKGSQKPPPVAYQPSEIEAFVRSHAKEYGYDAETAPLRPSCDILTNQTSPMYSKIQRWREGLTEYEKLLNEFTPITKDLRTLVDPCEKLRLGKDGLESMFGSKLPSTGSFGVIEPLMPPMRHPDFCYGAPESLMSISYIVHDFEALCRKSMRPTSRTALIDLGASLTFQGSSTAMIDLYSLFAKFGFHFDHYYAFEVTPTNARDVYNKIPREWLSNFHWINAGVEASLESPLNPWNILSDFEADDFVVVKLDIDNSELENALAQQLLENPALASRVDVFYYEHHVHMKELRAPWASFMSGSLAHSMGLFARLRELGIAAHSWI